MMPWLIGDEVAPMRSPGIRDGRCDDLEILRAVRVGEDEEPIAVMLDGVAQLRRARLDEARPGGGVAPVEQVDFGRFVIACDDEREGARLRLAEVDEEAGIPFLVDGLVPVGAFAEPVALDPGRAVILVEFHVIEAGGIGQPDGLARGSRNLVGSLEPGFEIADPDREILGTFGVGAPRDQAMVRGMLGSAEVEEGKPVTLLVAVEQDALGAAVAGLPAHEGVLPALAVAGEIGERPVRLRYGRVVLLDAAAHLGHETLAQVLRGRSSTAAA